MSELRSAVDELKSLPHRNLTVEQRHQAVVEMVYGHSQLEVALAETIRMLATHELRELGYVSAMAYLMDVGRMSGGRARQIVGLANTADIAPISYQSWVDGRISTDQASVLAKAATAVPDVFGDAEERLVDIIEALSAADASKAVEYWRQSVDGPGQLDIETQSQRRGVSLSKSYNGMHRIDGWLTSTAGSALQAAVNALMPPPSDDDTRTPRQRRHDALEDLTRHWLDHGDTPTVGGEKPHVSLLTDLNALKGVAGGTHETLTGDIWNVETLRQIACDTSISRIVLGPDTEVLNIGRKTRVWTTAQRRAIIARDRHCQGQGCDRPPQYCDIHHLDHWADGGTTTTKKGVLLCRFHHTQQHQQAAHKKRRSRTKG